MEGGMEVIPAVDLMDGKVVRLLRGDPKALKTYEHLGDAVTVAKRWEAEGAKIIHVVDLDAALGLGCNTKLIKEISRAVRVPVQVGGGIRSLDAARSLLSEGAGRVILGSLAFEEPQTVRALLDEFGGDHVVVALDHLKGEVMVRGWRNSTGLRVDDVLQRFMEMGVELFLVTSVAQDGTLGGPDLETLARICAYHGAEIIAAGGIGSLDDLVSIRELGIRGVVVGKALYEGVFTLKEALKAVEGG